MAHQGPLNNTAMSSARLPLEQLGVTDKTWNTYMNAVRKFTTWRKKNHLDWTTQEELDGLVARYANDLYHKANGKGRCQCVNLLCGLRKLFPRFTFQHTRLILRSWSKRKPPKSWPPISWDLTVLVARAMAARGRLRPAILMLLMHDAYLRITEATKMHLDDLLLPGDVRAGSAVQQAIICIPQGKTGANQAVSVRRPEISRLLSSLKRSRPGTELVGTIKASPFRTLFKKACADCELSNSHFVPHSLRHGGALNDYLLGAPIHDIMRRGRWQRDSTMAIYLRTCQGTLNQIHIPNKIARSAAYWSTRPIEALQDGLRTFKAKAVAKKRSHR